MNTEIYEFIKMTGYVKNVSPIITIEEVEKSHQELLETLRTMHPITIDALIDAHRESEHISIEYILRLEALKKLNEIIVV